MIIRIDKGDYYLIQSDNGSKFKVIEENSDRVYSQATELKDKPRHYIEVQEW